MRAESLLSLSLPAQQSSCTFPFFLFFPPEHNTTAQTQKEEEKDGGFYKWRDAILVKSNHIIPHARTDQPPIFRRAARRRHRHGGGRQPSAPRATSLCSGGPCARRPLLLTKSFAWVRLVGCRCCYSRRPRSRSGASGEARSASPGAGGAADASPVARLASHELSPSITPCPSVPPCLGICGVAPAPGSVGGAVVAPGPPDDFTLHVFVKKKKAQAVSEKERLVNLPKVTFACVAFYPFLVSAE